VFLQARTASWKLAATDKEPPKKTDVKVTLKFSVAELDPKEPGDSYVECVVRNDRKEAIRVPINYVGGFEDQVMAMHAEGLRLVVWAGEKQAKFARLEPGKELTVFKASLKELLLDPAMAKALKPQERRYYWSWDK
jgi:hypothetical protein